MALDTEIKDRIDSWLMGNLDPETRLALESALASDNETELTDAFYRNLEFGTGGLRGIMGVGTNRMNVYTVGMATQGLANYLLQSFSHLPQISVAIAYDSRNNSSEFANVVADVFSGNGIKVYFFKSLRPTPLLSFTIRHYGCQSGVVVTASHNPREYNGYKAYWDDGAQMIAPHDTNTIAEVAKITDFRQVQWERNPALIQLIGEETDAFYLDKLVGNVVNPGAIKAQSDLKIVYTPLHGTGITLVPQILERIGFTNVTLVEEQAVPDGNFPTVVYPNPEEPEAMSMALKLAEDIDADLVLATDPDADRVGIAAKDHHGNFVLLNGNQTATLLFYYVLKAWHKAGKLTGKEFIVKTIVTTNLLDAMAASFGVDCYNTLTGFKYIAGIIKQLEGKKQFIVGGEESYGYLVGDFVRDKDAVGSCAMIAEMVADAKNQNMTLFDLLTGVYMEFGMYKEGLVSITKKGKAGAEEIQSMMANYRAKPYTSLGGSKVVTLLDYKALTSTNLITGVVTPIHDIEASNVLQFITENGNKISARPSGTEPKIKFYFSLNSPLTRPEDFDSVTEDLDAQIKDIITEMELS